MIERNRTYSLSEITALRLELLSDFKYLENLEMAMKGETIDQIAWTRSALDCIKRKNEFVQTIEILSCMFDKEKLASRRNQYVTALSVALNKLCESGELVSKSYKGIKGKFYGLAQWDNQWHMEELDRKISRITSEFINKV